MGIGEWVLALIAVGLLGGINLALYSIADELKQLGTMFADYMEKNNATNGSKGHTTKENDNL